jgi:hypothetical protein
MDVTRIVEKFRAIREIGTAQIKRARAAHPDVAPNVWCRIACAWDDFHERHLNYEVQSDEIEKQLFEALLLISAGNVNPLRLGVPGPIGQRLIECYDDIVRD